MNSASPPAMIFEGFGAAGSGSRPAVGRPRVIDPVRAAVALDLPPDHGPVPPQGRGYLGMAMALPKSELDLDPFIETERMSRTGLPVLPPGTGQASAASASYEFHRTSIAPPLPAAVPRHANLPGCSRQRHARTNQHHKEITVILGK